MFGAVFVVSHASGIVSQYVLGCICGFASLGYMCCVILCVCVKPLLWLAKSAGLCPARKPKALHNSSSDIRGSESARQLGSTPARIWLKLGRVLDRRTRTAWNRRVEDASRPRTGPFRAASARFSRMADSGFRAAESRFLVMET